MVVADLEGEVGQPVHRELRRGQPGEGIVGVALRADTMRRLGADASQVTGRLVGVKDIGAGQNWVIGVSELGPVVADPLYPIKRVPAVVVAGRDTAAVLAGDHVGALVVGEHLAPLLMDACGGTGVVEPPAALGHVGGSETSESVVTKDTLLRRLWRQESAQP